MTTVTPRWEWRTFGRPGPVADEAFDAAEASAVAESDETYFLTGSGANVKIRDELVDIKLLRETDENGLERWEPVLKRPFPLGAADLATVAEAMGIDAAREVARGADVSYDDFLAIVGRDANARIVPVHKRRIRYTIGGCMKKLLLALVLLPLGQSAALAQNAPTGDVAAGKALWDNELRCKDCHGQPGLA